jgi:hypothetical protein
MSTFFFNTLPQMAIAEMQHQVPCNDALFEASTPEDFAMLNSSSPHHTLGHQSIKRLISYMMEDDWSRPNDATLDTIQPRHLMMCIFGKQHMRSEPPALLSNIVVALHSIVFVTRAALLLSSSYCLLSRALSRWKQLWDVNETETKGSIGFTKYGIELWWVARKVLELVHSGDTRSHYLAAIPTDSLRDLHEFIKDYANH